MLTRERKRLKLTMKTPPDTILVRITSMLAFAELFIVRSVSKKWNKIAELEMKKRLKNIDDWRLDVLRKNKSAKSRHKWSENFPNDSFRLWSMFNDAISRNGIYTKLNVYNFIERREHLFSYHINPGKENILHVKNRKANSNLSFDYDCIDHVTYFNEINNVMYMWDPGSVEETDTLTIKIWDIENNFAQKTFVLTKNMGFDSERFSEMEYASKDFVILSFYDRPEGSEESQGQWYELWDLRNGGRETLFPELPRDPEFYAMNWMFDQKANIFVCNAIADSISFPVIFDFHKKFMKRIIHHGPQVERTLYSPEYWNADGFRCPRLELAPFYSETSKHKITALISVVKQHLEIYDTNDGRRKLYLENPNAEKSVTMYEMLSYKVCPPYVLFPPDVAYKITIRNGKWTATEIKLTPPAECQGVKTTIVDLSDTSSVWRSYDKDDDDNLKFTLCDYLQCDYMEENLH